MNPPTRGEAIEILSNGKQKNGWRWLEDVEGNWWRAKERADYILQVRDEKPDFPTRQWSATGWKGFAFEGCEERFTGSIVVAISRRAHA